MGWTKRIPFNDSRTEVFYLGRTSDNRVHIGGGHADYIFNNGLGEPSQAERRYLELRRELGRIYPSLAGETFETTWNGAVDYSLDQTPVVGQMGKHANVFYGIGFSGHGVNLTSVFGRIIADLLQGRASAWRWFPYLDRLPLYMPNEPLRWVGFSWR
jgi:gamma-glutamylputrescine oxidase